jgi:ABC-type nitrate/sulfonate/bicarbonate transport system permease component
MTARRRWVAEHWITIASPIALLLLWEWASATGLLRAAFFPRPSTIAVHLRDLALDGTLWDHLAITLTRIGWAFTLAAVLGVGIGLAMGLWRRLREGLDPVFAVIYPIPSVLFLPLVSFLVPPGEIALIVTTAVTSFFLIAFTTTHGVRQIDRRVVEAALHYGARGRRLFAAVLLPGALPFIFTGLRLGLGFSLIVVVAVEIVSAGSGRSSGCPGRSSRSRTCTRRSSSSRSSARSCPTAWRRCARGSCRGWRTSGIARWPWRCRRRC